MSMPVNRSYATHVRRANSNESPLKFVQIDGHVVLKIIKHSHEEGGPAAEIQGVLLGLIMDGRLEVTHCFPFPHHNDDDEVDDDYQYVMMRHLRNVNVDHLHVGWYTTNPFGNTISKLEIADSQFIYQTSIEESIVLLYDPVRTQKGFFSLKAYRLSNLAMKLCKEGEFSFEAMKSNQMSFDKFFEEIPIQIKNSLLTNALLCEFEERMPIDEGKQFLDLGTVSVLEKSLQPLMKCVEELSRWANYQKQLVLKQQQIVKENAARSAKGEPPLNEDEINKIIKPTTPLQRLEAILNNYQTLNFCQQSSTFATQTIGKLFMARALQEAVKKPNAD